MTPVSTRAAQIAKMVMLNPRTANEMCVALGIDLRNIRRVQVWLDSFHDQGCVFIKAYRAPPGAHRPRPVYEWQPVPFRYPDVPKPLR